MGKTTLLLQNMGKNFHRINVTAITFGVTGITAGLPAAALI
jgi:hypothetical protein